MPCRVKYVCHYCRGYIMDVNHHRPVMVDGQTRHYHKYDDVDCFAAENIEIENQRRRTVEQYAFDFEEVDEVVGRGYE